MPIEPDDNETEAYYKLLEAHLSTLTIDGRTLLNITGSAAKILESDFLGSSKLTEDEKREFFKMLNDAVEKHFKLLKQTIEERRAFFGSNQQDRNSTINLE